VLDRQRAGIDLLAVIGRDLRGEVAAQLLERAPQPPDPPVGLALVRQPGEQVRPVARHLGQEARLAAAAQQMPDLRDGQQLGVAAARSRARSRRDRDDPGSYQVINQHVDVDEQVLGGQHGGRPLRWQTVFDTRMSAAEALP
jgi:hypothetical protein